MEKKVSIIIPVYNAEKFIEKGINSVVNQSYKNIELLLLNDGSTDKSLNIIKKWESEYPDIIKVYSHKNMGVGKTRNKGIEKSTGDYICFVDADDYLADDFIEKMMNFIDKNDIVVSGYKQVDENDNVNFVQKLKKDEWSKFRQVTIWSKIYKKSFLEKNNIKFNELKIGEDITFSLSTYVKTNKIVSTSYVGYYNVENQSSVTHNVKLKKDNNIISMLNILSELSNDKKFLKANKKNIQYFYLKTFVFFLIDKSKVLNEVDLKLYYNETFGWIKNYFNKNNLALKIKWNTSEPMKVNFAIFIVLFVNKFKLSNLFIKMLHKFFYK